MMDNARPFDRALLRRRRDRAAAGFGGYDFLVREVAARLLDRLDDISRDFADVLDLGCHTGQAAEILGSRAGIASLVQADLSPRMAEAAAANGLPALAADEEALPFRDKSFDLIVSVLGFHWVNDLPGALIQANRCLRPDGVLLVAMFAGNTLHELRQSLLAAESETTGGAAPRVSPFADVRDLGNLLQRAGFALPVADHETITVRYESPLKLIGDLRGMAESSALNAGLKSFTRRDSLMRAVEVYAERYTGDDGRVPATFEIVTLTAWAPDASQPKPLAPGSATTNLAEVLGDKAEGK